MTRQTSLPDWVADTSSSSLGLHADSFKVEREQPIMLSDVKRLVLNPGDTIVLTCAQPLNNDQADRLKQRIRDLLGDHEVIVLANGLDIGVISKQ
jgi:hypothetical protein